MKIYICVLKCFMICGAIISLTMACSRKSGDKVSGEIDIFSAAKSGDIDSVNSLIQSGISVNSRNTAGITPLHLASENGHINVMLYLIENGANVTVEDDKGVTPLHLAAAKGQKKAAEILISNGANVNSQNKYGSTPLVAATMGQGQAYSVAEILLENGAQTNLQMSDGATALHRAVMNGQPGILKLLLLNGANPNMKNNMRQTPLVLAIALCQATFRPGSKRSKMGPQFQECRQILQEWQSGAITDEK